MKNQRDELNPEDLTSLILPLVGKNFLEVSKKRKVPFSKNLNSKGVVGHFVEDLVGLPRSNSRLDFRWGELKALTYHIGKELDRCVVGSMNSLAEQVIEENVDFDDFILGKKISQVVFVTVCTNRKQEKVAGAGWEKFTFEGVSHRTLKNSPWWEGIKEDWEHLKGYVKQCSRTGEYVSSSEKGPNNYLCFNSMAGRFTWGGRNLRRNGGIQLALGTSLIRQVCT